MNEQTHTTPELPSSPADIMTARDVMILLGVSRSTITNWQKRSVLTPIYIGGLMRFRRDEIEAAVRRTNKSLTGSGN